MPGHVLFWAAVVTVSVIAGALNRTTGSGNVLLFLVLIALGVPPLVAHLAGQVAAPASFAGAWRVKGHEASAAMIGAACLGTIGGAFWLAHASSAWIAEVAPVGVAVSAIMLALAPLSQSWTTKHRIPLLFLAGTFGGTVGAGVGTVVWACVDALGRSAWATRNALCLPMGLVVSGVLLATSPPWHPGGLIHWPLAGAVAAGMVVGGEAISPMVRSYLDAHTAAPARLRAAVVSVSASAAVAMASHSAALTLLMLLLMVAGYRVAHHLHQPPSLGTSSSSARGTRI